MKTRADLEAIRSDLNIIKWCAFGSTFLLALWTFIAFVN